MSSLTGVQCGIRTIAAGPNGSYLAIDQESTKATVEATLAALGVSWGSSYAKQARQVSRKVGIVETTEGPRVIRQHGHATVETWRLGIEVAGPDGPGALLAQLRVTDRTIPGAPFLVEVGVHRLVCLNGMWGFGQEFSSRVIHRVGPVNEGRLADVPGQIAEALSKLPALGQAAARLAAIPVARPVAVIDSLVAVGALPKRVGEAAALVIQKARYRAADAPTTVWGLYNILNETDRLLAARGASLAALERDSGLPALIEAAVATLAA